MRVIFLENIKNIAKKGEIREVSEGFARNFLLPKKMAEIATEKVIENAKINQAEAEKAKQTEISQANNLVGKLKEAKIVLKSKGEKNKLFGSITAKDITEALKKAGFELSEENIMFKKHIKTIGEHEVGIDLGRGVKTKINIAVESE